MLLDLVKPSRPVARERDRQPVLNSAGGRGFPPPRPAGFAEIAEARRPRLV